MLQFPILCEQLQNDKLRVQVFADLLSSLKMTKNKQQQQQLLCLLTRPRFSVEGWEHTSGNTSVPVVVEARPQDATSLMGGIIHSYSFLDFYFIDPGFGVHSEIWCWGAVHGPLLPKLPSRFDVNLEYLFEESGRIWASRVSIKLCYGDRDLGVLKIDRKGLVPGWVGDGGKCPGLVLSRLFSSFGNFTEDCD